MASDTGIEWTDRTWNPVRGCSRVSPGCQNCYAERIATRFSGPGKPYDGLIKLLGKRHPATGQPPGGTRGRWNGTVRMIDRHLHDPLAWREPSKIFVNSMSDLFHENLSVMDIAAVFGVMAVAARHTFQFLTKREVQMRYWYRMLVENAGTNAIITAAYERLADAGQRVWADEVVRAFDGGVPWPLPNVWAGVSVENREHGLPRIDALREIPATVRFLSIEPLLEDLGELDLTGIHWVIVGCESGPGARPCKASWIRNVRDACRRYGVPMFLKQANDEIELAPAPHHAISMSDRSTQKTKRLIGLPALDGVVYANFPKTESTSTSCNTDS